MYCEPYQSSASALSRQPTLPRTSLYLLKGQEITNAFSLVFILQSLLLNHTWNLFFTILKRVFSVVAQLCTHWQ